MSAVVQQLAQELSLRPQQVENALALLQEGATIPFIARYRKERTGEMDEVQLRQLQDRYTYIQQLAARKESILQAIAEQGKLTDDLKAKITACTQKNELEDLYLPYRRKRRTRATKAREKGLQPLAEWIEAENQKASKSVSLEDAAANYINTEVGVDTTEAALQGASDIIAEAIAERADVRSQLRDIFAKSAVVVSTIKEDYPEGTTKFEMYRDYQIPITKIAPHNLLALFRGQEAGIVKFDLSVDSDRILSHLASQILISPAPSLKDFYTATIRDAYTRLLKPATINAVLADKKAEAEQASVETFANNLCSLLLSPPAGMQATLGIDPGFRTGCKVAVVDETGKFLEYQTIFPHQSHSQRQQASQTLQKLLQKYPIAFLAIGNGTASRETSRFVEEVLANLPYQEKKPIAVTVNESGASVYSASEVAREEFPHLDATVRGAISIARRLQDPLAELVKIDPKSIGVGQYQHDVDQKLLHKKLHETVESCVNYVGVDVNTASKQLLTYVSGITPTIANNIIAYRNQNGAFRDRQELLRVKKLGVKSFEQAAGFLRIRQGNNPLDNTGVHPESYAVVKAIAADINLSLSQISQVTDKLHQIDLRRYTSDTVGEPTLRDIIQELEKPGRDPRQSFTYANFAEDVHTLEDLRVGMQLEGVVTNVANFGAFVDIGVHQDGLVHISQLADRFVRDPNEIVRVGQVVQVRVLEVNEKLRRIGLSMKSP
jgi:uncharacterized protein